MKGKLLFAIIFTVLGLISMAISVAAQEPFNVNCIRQFESNWHGRANDVCTQGNYAYVACDYDGFRIVDISRPGAYSDVAQLNTGRATAVAVSGDLALAGISDSGVTVINVSVKSQPVVVVSLPIAGYKSAIRIFNRYAYVCTPNGLTVVDLASPMEPSIVSTFDIDYSAFDVVVRDNLAYVACEYTGLKVFDITNILAPQYVNGYDLNDGNMICGVALHDNYAILACGFDGLRVVDLTTMSLVSSIDSLSFALWVKVSGDYAYLAYGYPDCPLAIVNIANPLALEVTGIYDPPEDIATFEVVDNVVHVADYRHGLRRVDVSDPYHPFECARYNRYGFEKGVDIEGDLAYVQTDLKLTAIDIADPRAPQEMGYFETNWDYSDFKVSGNIAYVLVGEPCVLYAVDFSIPSTPTLLGEFAPSDYNLYYRMDIYDHYICLLGWSNILFLDVSDPANISLSGTYEMDTRAAQILVYGHYAITQDRQDRFVTMDIQNPAQPVVISLTYASDRYDDFKVSDNTLYATSPSHLTAFNISNLAHWGRLSNTLITDESPYVVHHMDISGSRLFLSSEEFGLSIYDIMLSANPVKVGYYDTPGTAYDVAAYGNIALVADRTNLGFYEFSTTATDGDGSIALLPQSINLLSNYPNPFNSSTVIRFETAVKGKVAIDILDIMGRQISTLAENEYGPGYHEIRWDGQDNTGATVASGRYFVRAVSDGHSQSLPVTLLK